MINLLPEAEKHERVKIYRTSLLSLALIFLLIGILVAVALMFPSYLILHTEEREIKNDLEKINKRVNQEDLSQNEKKLEELESQRAFLSAGEMASTTADLIKEILDARKAGVKITSINYADGIFDLKGVAERRANLLEFIKALETLPSHKEVKAPLSNLLSEKNVNFSLTLK